MLPDPTVSKMTAIDACSIEAATFTRHRPIGPMNSGHPQGRIIRPVDVYLWSKTITSRDTWAYMIASLPGVHLGYMDVTQVGNFIKSYSNNNSLIKLSNMVNIL